MIEPTKTVAYGVGLYSVSQEKFVSIDRGEGVGGYTLYAAVRRANRNNDAWGGENYQWVAIKITTTTEVVDSA